VVVPGFGYVKEPVIKINNASGTPNGEGAAKARCFIEEGSVSEVIVLDRGHGYTSAPTCAIDAADGAAVTGFTNTNCTLRPVMRPAIAGKYWCAYRYVDDTPVGSGGPIASSLSEVTEIEIAEPTQQLDWSQINAGPDVRASKIELWRTTADQAAVFYHVATIPPATASATGSASTDVITSSGHDLSNGDMVRLTALTGGAGLSTGVAYYVRDATTNTFKAAATSGGAAIDFTSDITAATITVPATYTDKLSDADLTSPSRLLPCTASNGSDTITCAGHGLTVGDTVRFYPSITGTGLVVRKTYYVVSATATTFSVSASAGGTAISMGAAITNGFVRCNSFTAMPAVLPNGQPNARRFRPPPQNKSTIVMFQDRAWYGVDVAGRTYGGAADSDSAEPNKLYFSEVDEPESVPSPNELILQDNVNGADKITALMPFGGAMVVFQERHCYRLAYAAQPVIDANFTLIAQRGCFNQRCFANHDGVAYVADSMGVYVLDGSTVTPISDGIDNYWTESVIHFGSSQNFFVSVDPVTRIARFHFCTTAGYPDRALCFHPVTKAWWEEQYAQRFGASSIARLGGRQRLIAGAESGAVLLADQGASDINAAGGQADIACLFRTGNFPLLPNGQDRSVRLLYRPTSSSASLFVNLHYNNSATARPSAIATDRGTGFTTTQSGSALINMASSRSALGQATGYAVAAYAGRLDDRSAGGDRHIAVGLSATRPSGEAASLYGLAIEGAGS
jgi:hypothetical protein